MKRLNLFWKVAVLVAMLCPTTLTAQHWVVAAGGGHVNSGDLLVDYTIGQVFVGIVGNDNVLLTQGFQQGYGPWANNQGGNNGSGNGNGDGTGTGGNGDGTGTANALAEVSESAAVLSLYPNPAADNVRVGLGTIVCVPVSISLYAMDGRMVLCRTFEPNQSEYELSLNALPAGVYVVRIVAPGQHFKTAKLVKR